MPASDCDGAGMSRRSSLPGAGESFVSFIPLFGRSLLLPTLATTPASPTTGQIVRPIHATPSDGREAGGRGRAR